MRAHREVLHRMGPELHCSMPTTRPRHIITETDSIAAALDVGQRRWPGLSRGKVVAKLVEEAARALEVEGAGRARRRRGALRNPPSNAQEWYPSDYLQDLREDWPA